MKKRLMIISAAALLLLSMISPVYVSADTPTQSGGSVSLPGGDPAMPLDGSWVVLDEVMDPGDYFTGPYTWDAPYLVRFTITDLFVISDQFEVYDNGELVVTTPAMSDWDDLGYASPGVGGPFPPWTNDPDVAFGSGLFSSSVLYFGPGSHSIDIRDIHIPPLTDAEDSLPFPDGTVAFKAEPLVEFTKEIADTVEGGDMDGVLEMGEKWTWYLETTLTNISGETIHVGKVHDRIGGDLESGWISYTAVLGPLDMYTKGKTDKVFYDFEGDFDLADGASVAFNIWVSPDLNTGTGNGKKAGHQEFTSTGEHCLNSGAWFEGWIGDEYIEASTEPVCVEVCEDVLS